MMLIAPIVAVVFVILIVAPLSLYYAWAASILWGWFVVPAFGVQPLSTLQLWGICLFLSMLRPRFNFAKADPDGWDSGLTALIIAPPLSLGIGYVIKFWLMA